jgi:membrane protease YdiL (CAAX protease family)
MTDTGWVTTSVRGPDTGSEPGRPWLPSGRRLLTFEIVIVLALSLGKSAVYAVVDIVASATAPGGLSAQVTVMNSSKAPGRPWLDLVLQLLGLGFGLVPVVLVGYLLLRDGLGWRSIGLDRSRPARDVGGGMLLAAAVGGAGLVLYLISHAMGVNLTVVAADLPDVWWRVPVLLLAALQNALLEEVVVVGYLLLRLRQLGVGDRTAVGISALLRGSYHLYQGFGGFAGNVAMGLIFGAVYRRWGRLGPLVVAHTLMDAVAFVGFTLLAGKVSWLPS